MRTLDHTYTEREERHAHVSPWKSLTETIAQLSETIWLCITFLLFIVMGPFSVIAVLYGLWSLAMGEHKDKMVEPASCKA